MDNDPLNDFKARLTADASPSYPPLTDSQLAGRIEERGIAGREAAATARDVPPPVARRWASLDAQDLALIADKHTARMALSDIEQNLRASSAYDAQLADNYKSVRDGAIYVGAQEQRASLAKDARKNAEFERMQSGLGGIDPGPTASVAANLEAERRKANAAEENRARLEAWRELSRDQAVSGFPSLKAAYELRDASAVFAKAHIADQGSAVAFAKLTEEFIERRLVRNEPLPELQKVRRERDRLADPDRDTLESHGHRETEIER